MTTDELKKLTEKYPLVNDLIALTEVAWFNPQSTTLANGLSAVGLTESDVKDASDRLARFADYLRCAFPETEKSAGIFESPLVEIPSMKMVLEQRYGQRIPGKLLLKQDSHLPVSGSIKARGGIYEVLAHAEKLAISHGLLSPDENYSKLFSDKCRRFFSQFRIAVGSTGNLGLSIGIMSSVMGFQVNVHMSADAREWKKARLRSHGVNVFEYREDYSRAVEEGRKQAEGDDNHYFIDDENSRTLFLGYAVAGERLKKQLTEMNITVNAEHPLFVYLPCGVGGGPGGVAFGLKLAFGDHVHCVFAEPTHSPCMLLGVYTGLHDGISVQEIGIDNITAADGLAVGRPSGFVGRAMQKLLDGFITVSDEEMYNLLSLLAGHEDIFLEPSALAGMPGPVRIMQNEAYLARMQFDAISLSRATHIVWATGGGMVPENEMESYLRNNTL